MFHIIRVVRLLRVAVSSHTYKLLGCRGNIYRSHTKEPISPGFDSPTRNVPFLVFLRVVIGVMGCF